MGGWCALREHCRQYHLTRRSEPRERLCLPGRDGESDEYRIVLHRRAGTWERPAQPRQVAA